MNQTIRVFYFELDTDAAEFVAELHRLKVVPHVAQNKSGRRSAVADEMAQRDGYGVSLQCRKRIEQGFGWAKTVGQVRQVMVRGLQKVGQMFVLNMAAYNLVRALVGTNPSAGCLIRSKRGKTALVRVESSPKCLFGSSRPNDPSIS